MKNFPKWCQLYIRKYPAIHAYVQEQTKTGGRSFKYLYIKDFGFGRKYLVSHVWIKRENWFYNFDEIQIYIEWWW